LLSDTAGAVAWLSSQQPQEGETSRSISDFTTP
jgi:hypothetical protein